MIPGKTGDSFNIRTTVYQEDGITIQPLDNATVVCTATEPGGHVVVADTCVITNPPAGIVDSFFADGVLGNGTWHFHLQVTIDLDVKIVVREVIEIDDLLPEAS